MDQRIGELHYRIVLDVQISSTQPRISVVIPLYNYDVHVVEALQSISLQTIQGIELIVVDDGSKDRSFEVAKKWLDANQASFSRVVLAQNAVNSGLPYTRNVGFTIATTDSVFPIDADNLIYPRCLERCHAAMQRHEVAVVYTIIERFGAEHRLANLAPWSRDTFRCGNQIDAMALISRKAWAQVGGYDPAMRLGWEDYELWLRFCDAGLSGLQVPEILGRYRVHLELMTKTVTGKRRALATLKRQLQARYPWTFLATNDDDALTVEPVSVDGSADTPLSPASAATSIASLQPDAPGEVENPTPPGVAMAVPFKYLPQPISGSPPSLAAIIHIHYPELTGELCTYLRNMPASTGIFISTNTPDKRAKIAEALERWQVAASEIRVLPNRGRDIAPKLVGFADVHDCHDFVLHLHTKRSPHILNGVSWRHFLFEHLLGSPLIIQNVLAALQRRPDLGMLYPQHWEPIRNWIYWGGNLAAARSVAERLGVRLPHSLALDFPSGSMFWARSAALRPILDLRLSLDDFPPETGQTDCTLAHTIERLYTICCEQAGFRWAKIAVPNLHRDQRGILDITSDADLDWFITQLTRRHLPEPPVRLPPALAAAAE